MTVPVLSWTTFQSLFTLTPFVPQFDECRCVYGLRTVANIQDCYDDAFCRRVPKVSRFVDVHLRPAERTRKNRLG